MATQDPHSTQPNRDELLKEYELCQASARALETQIWQTGGAVGFGSIGSLILVAEHELPWLAVLSIGFVVVSATFIWMKMAMRWWSVQHAFFLRMRHLESQLGLFQTRYLDFLDNPDHLDNALLDPVWAEDIRARSRKRDGNTKAHERTGVRQALSCFPWVVMLGWVGLFAWRFCAA